MRTKLMAYLMNATIQSGPFPSIKSSFLYDEDKPSLITTAISMQNPYMFLGSFYSKSQSIRFLVLIPLMLEAPLSKDKMILS